MTTTPRQRFTQFVGTYTGAPRRKESFDLVYDVLTSNGVATVLDIGTAAGDFPYFLPPPLRCLGVDIREPLIEEARRDRKRPGVDFALLDAMDSAALMAAVKHAPFDGAPLDAVVLLGTLGGFMDPEPLWESIFSLDEWRTLVLHDNFNRFDIDTRHACLDHGRPGEGWQNAFNIFSLATIERTMARFGAGIANVTPFQMKSDLVHHPDEPRRAWHVRVGDEGRYTTNGLGLLLDQYVITIRR